MEKKKGKRKQYDHRLRAVVWETRDIDYAMEQGVPESTAKSWLKNPPGDVIADDFFDLTDVQVRAHVLKLQRRIKCLTAIMILLLSLIRVSKIKIDYKRLANGINKKRLLRAINRAQKALSLKTVLRIVGLSSTRYHSWERAQKQGCELDDRSSCPKTNPRQLLPKEIREMKELSTSPDYRHVPTGRLALLAQRLGKVFTSPSTWSRYIKERGWRWPRNRIHPQKPTQGLRTDKPNAMWHIDITVIRMLDGTKAYLQAVIDNYSRRILSWRIGLNIEPGATAALLVKAYRLRTQATSHTDEQSLMVDGGVENYNAEVNELVDDGTLKRILAQTEISFSNSLIEAFWRILKHHWLFLNSLDSLTTLERLIAFYINEYNSQIPHSAFKGQTPDEMYLGTGADVPENLAIKRRQAMKARIKANQTLTCENCETMTKHLKAVNS